MGDFSFLIGLKAFVDNAKDSNETEIQCVSSIDHYKFYQLLLIPTIVLTLMMAFTKPRRHKLLSFLDGRPGLIFPMDTMTRSSRISYCCAFGAAAFLVYQILLDHKTAIDYKGPLIMKTIIAIVSMFIYGMVFLPVFTSLALATAFSYSLGTLYVWVLSAVEIFRVTECKFNAAGRAILVIRALPSLFCLAYLSISMPVKLCLAVRNKNYLTPSLGEDPYNETVEQIKESYQGRYVRKLLRKPQKSAAPQGKLHSFKICLTKTLCSRLYHRQSGFRYPSRLMSVMFVAGCVVYVLTVEFLVQFVSLFNGMLEDFEILIDSGDPEEETTDMFYVMYYLTDMMRISLIVSLTVSALISFVTMLHMMSSFRINLLAMYRGDYSHIPSPYTKSATSLCTGSIKYGGFQVAYIVWAYVITSILLFIICIGLAGCISLVMFGISDWLVYLVSQLWPGVVSAIVLSVGQLLLAKYVFLQDRGQYLRLDNRRFYFVFVYFMFFYNIFLGLFSCLMRIIKAIAVGTVFLSRLDNSTLPRKFEFLDPGFSAYQGYIHMEAAHTHPVVNVFIRLLVALSQSKRKQKSEENDVEMCFLAVSVENDPEIGANESSTDKQKPVNITARFNWHLIYTLLQNPTVRIYRKGFIQSIKKARKEGLKIPISDKPITDFELVKAQENRDRQKEEEAKRNSKSVQQGVVGIGSSFSAAVDNEVKYNFGEEKC